MSTAVQVEQIGVNRYAPEGANAVNLYAFSGVYDLTLAQLMMAICIRSASVIEEQSVLKMNEISDSASYIDVLSQAGDRVMTRSSLDATFDLTKTSYVPKNKEIGMKPTYWEFLVYEVGLQEEAVPHTVSKLDEKTKLFELIADKLNVAVGDNERQVIDLESYLSRRDSTYNAASSTVKRLGNTMNAVANNF